MLRFLILMFITLFSIIVSTELPKRPSSYFSPNLDGSKDQFKRRINIKDDSMIIKWRFKIFSSRTSTEPIMSYESRHAKEILHMTPKKFFKRIFEKKKEVEIPKIFSWKGENRNGDIVPDVTYPVFFLSLSVIR